MECLPKDIQRRIESQEARIDRVWEERKAAVAAAGIRRLPRKPPIYTEGQGGTTSNMIPSPSHFTKDPPSNISHIRTRPATNNLFR